MRTPSPLHRVLSVSFAEIGYAWRIGYNEVSVGGMVFFLRLVFSLLHRGPLWTHRRDS